MAWWEWIIVIGLWVWVQIDLHRVGEWLQGIIREVNCRRVEDIRGLEMRLDRIERERDRIRF